jgi:hypothetical protein
MSKNRKGQIPPKNAIFAMFCQHNALKLVFYFLEYYDNFVSIFCGMCLAFFSVTRIWMYLVTILRKKTRKNLYVILVTLVAVKIATGIDI